MIILTDIKGRSWGGIQWGDGVTHTVATGLLPGDARSLWAFRLSALAIAFVAPAIVHWGVTRAWESEGVVSDAQDFHVLCSTLTALREINLPRVSLEQRCRFAIRCAAETCNHQEWRAWADDWVSGRDRSRHSAYEASFLVFGGRAAPDAALSVIAADRAVQSAREGLRHEVDTEIFLTEVFSAQAATCARHDSGLTIDLDAIAQWAMTDDPLPAMEDGPNA